MQVYDDSMVRRAIGEMEDMDEYVCPILSLMARRPMPCAGSDCAWHVDDANVCVIYRLNLLTYVG